MIYYLFQIASQAHRQIHGNTREPLLENITSDYDLELFRKAQARASEDLVHLAVSHLCMQFYMLGFFFLIYHSLFSIFEKCFAAAELTLVLH